MKHSLMAGLLWMLLLWQPVETGHSQQKTTVTTLPSKADENGKLRILITQKQEVIINLAKQLPDKPKIIYIKVYEKPPKKKQQKGLIPVQQDKLKLLVTDSITGIPVIKPDIKKQNFFQRLKLRLFHHKKTNI